MLPRGWPSSRQLAVSVAVVAALGALLSFAWLSGVGAGAVDDPITASGTLNLLGNAEYYPSNESLRYRTPTGSAPPGEDRPAFEEHKRIDCRGTAADRVRVHLEERFGRPAAVGIDADGVEVDASLSLGANPNYYRLERHFPETVHVTLDSVHGTFTCSVSVDVVPKTYETDLA